jgi:Pvc16 N-terminal domain
VSNHLAFSTVTAALRSLLNVPADKAFAGAKVTAERPDSLKDQPDTPRVNLFLYQVTPNGHWRNDDLATRRPDGTLAQRPQAAFDLHYLLTFYGVENDYVPQRILGSVVSVLHSQPVLSRGIVRDASTGSLVASDLAEQVELVRFTPLPLNLEELSKLWSVFFQVPYKLSLAYQASVVLIEPEVSTQPALPVRARNLYVVPFRQPEVDDVVSAAGLGEPIVFGDTIVLRGRNLWGEVIRVRIGGVEVVPDADKVRDDEIRIALPAGLPAGVLGAQVVHLRQMGTTPTPHRGVESNAAPFVLRPRIKTKMVGPDEVPDIDVSSPTGEPGVHLLKVSVEPRVGIAQRAVLALHGLAGATPAALSVAADPRTADGDVVEFRARGLQSTKEYLVRVQIDGAESLLEVDSAGLYSGPKVKIP